MLAACRSPNQRRSCRPSTKHAIISNSRRQRHTTRPERYPHDIDRSLVLPSSGITQRLTIIRKVFLSSVASRWHTALYPVKPDTAAPCALMLAAAPTTDPGTPYMKDDAWVISATRQARRAKARPMVEVCRVLWAPCGVPVLLRYQPIASLLLTSGAGC